MLGKRAIPKAAVVGWVAPPALAAAVPGAQGSGWVLVAGQSSSGCLRAHVGPRVAAKAALLLRSVALVFSITFGYLLHSVCAVLAVSDS